MNASNSIKILIIGCSGMLGNTLVRYFSDNPNFIVRGTVRTKAAASLLPSNVRDSIFVGIDADNLGAIDELLESFRPDVVINCVGVVKQLSSANDPLVSLPINSLFPHRLARVCVSSGSRLIHISTDCVFTGSKGMYCESDIPDARDMYGISKFLGEVNYPNTITLRTSIIGHELSGTRSLVDWFLSQQESVLGYKNAIFSGLPTIEIAKLISRYVIPNPHLTGIYHVSAEPINKYELLKLIAEVYLKDIEIVKDVDVKIDRSLNSSRFRALTGFTPSSWLEMVSAMRNFG